MVQDADLEYDPRDYRPLMEPLLDGRADMVYGSRFLGGPHRVLLFWHYVGNRILTLVSNLMCNLNLTDMETGMKAFRRDKLVALKLNADRFTFEPEITAKAARARWRIYEVPISYSGRTYERARRSAGATRSPRSRRSSITGSSTERWPFRPRPRRARRRGAAELSPASIRNAISPAAKPKCLG